MSAQIEVLHHRSTVEVVLRRIESVVGRLECALSFETTDVPVLAQTIHAIDFAMNGPLERDDDDYIRIAPNDALALVRALLPFLQAARTRPGCEGCSVCLPAPTEGEPT